MQMKVKIDNTEAIVGTGIVKEQLIQIQKPRHFMVYGSLYNILTPEKIKKISSVGGAAIETVMRVKPETSAYAEFVGCLCNSVLTLGLGALKKISGNLEIVSACDYIIKMMKYCRMDLPEEYNPTLNTQVEEVLSTLPISRASAQNIYAFFQMTSFDISKSKVGFDNIASQNLAYILFSMFESQGRDWKSSQKMREAFGELMIHEGDIQNFKDSYAEDAEEKTLHLLCLKEIFENANFEKLDMNPRYVGNVLKKLNDCYPASVSKMGRIARQGVNLVTDIYLGEKDNCLDAGYNLFSEILQTIYDGSKANKDNIAEVFEEDVRNRYGSDIANQGDKIIGGAKDYGSILKS